MYEYKTFQFNRLIFIVIPLMGWLYYLYATEAGNNPMPEWAMLAMEGIFLLVFLMFYGLTVIIHEGFIRLKFGIGLIRIKVRIEDIEEARTVRNKWYYGIGIKTIPRGILYNVYGLDAVELAMKNGKVIRIGSPECENLKYELERRIG